MRQIKKRTAGALVITAIVALGAASVAAYGGFFYDTALGTVVPTPATAYLTCYTVDPGFELANGSTARQDVLSVFVRKETDGKSTVCYLRPPSAGGGVWLPAATAPVLVGR
jgi:hypothetical protein